MKKKILLTLTVFAGLTIAFTSCTQKSLQSLVQDRDDKRSVFDNIYRSTTDVETIRRARASYQDADQAIQDWLKQNGYSSYWDYIEKQGTLHPTGLTGFKNGG
jgi:hypothetical protein